METDGDPSSKDRHFRVLVRVRDESIGHEGDWDEVTGNLRFATRAGAERWVARRAWWVRWAFRLIRSDVKLEYAIEQLPTGYNAQRVRGSSTT